MALGWYHNIETIFYSDIRATMGLIAKHTNINAKTVEWMHQLAFYDKLNSDENPTWDYAMNVPQKEGHWMEFEKEIGILNKKHAWEVVNREEWMNVLTFTCDFHKNVTQTEEYANSKLAFAPEMVVKLKE